MTPTSFFVQPLRIAAVLALGGCYSVDCVTLPCAAPMALIITVSNAASGGGVPNAVVQFGAQSTPCAGTPTSCAVPGYRGTYTVTISAPAFQSASRTVTVNGTDGGECHCATVDTGHLSIALTPN
jgi:hypothetical protein